MGKLEELLKYDKVEWKKLGEVLDYERPNNYIVESTKYSDKFNTPVLTAGQKFILGYTDETQGIFHADTQNPVIIFDDFTASSKWANFNFKLKSSAIKLLKSKNEAFSLRYCYHYMQTIKFNNSEHKRIWISQYSNIKIPIPPLSLQAEIVRILDTFTHLTDGLITALTKELELRETQYRYYLEKLFSKEYLKECAKEMDETESVRILTLADVCEISAGGDVPKHSFSEEENDEYNVPIISNGTAKNAIYGYTSQAKITKPAVTISARGTIGYVEYRDYPYYPIVRLLSLVPKQDSKLLTKYLYYYLLQKEFLTPTAGIKQLTIPMIKEETIPLPALSIQEKIVKILDHLSSLVHNIEEGLLSEIAFRQKQYEYYRGKLLNFSRQET